MYKSNTIRAYKLYSKKRKSNTQNRKLSRRIAAENLDKHAIGNKGLISQTEIARNGSFDLNSQADFEFISSVSSKKFSFTKNIKFNKRSKNNKLRRKLKFKNFFIIAFVILTTIFFSALTGTVKLLADIQTTVTALPTPQEIINGLTLATVITDRNGVELYRLHNDESNADKASLDSINNYTVAAFLAAEDSDFYYHKGINIQAIVRCVIKAAEGGDICGGSTITQQVVKILTKENAPTVERKLEEIFNATNLEKDLTKNEILELYFNVTPYGSNIRGIKTAAKQYFNINNLRDLTLEQSVALAAIINNPVFLSPTLSPDPDEAISGLRERMDYIYSQLERKLDYINEQIQTFRPDESELISREKILATKDLIPEFKKPEVSIKAGHFVQFVIDELTTKPYKNGKPFSLSDLQTGGYRIVTTLNYDLQQIAERYVLKGGNDYKWANVYNAAMLSISPSTGEVIVMVGSKSYFGESEGCDANGENCKYDPEVNVLTTLQSPGSTNKPLGYYLAYEQGKIFPGSALPDVPVSFGNYYPKNWDNAYMGPGQTAKQMLRYSRNIPALIVMKLVGVDNYIAKAKSFGYTTYENANQFGISLILGGGDVYPVEHAGAYAVFANDGVKVPLNSVKEIYDSDDNLIYQAVPEQEQVADPAAVYLLNQSLYNLDTGNGSTIAWDYRDIAGKTGTTENNKDNWLVIYSPDFVTLGWVGNNNNEPLNYQWGWPAFVVAPWLKGYMAEATNAGYYQERTPFKKPENVYYGGGNCINGFCRGISADWLIAGREPAVGDVRVVSTTKTDVVTSVDEEGNEVQTTETLTIKTKTYHIPVPEVQWALNNWNR